MAPTRSSFLANWNIVSGATGYRLDVSTGGSFNSYVSGYQDLDVGNVTSRIVSGLSSGTTYYYRVRAYNALGTSSGSDSNVMTVTTATASGLVINPTFGSSILNNPNSAAIQSMINQAIAIYQSLFSDAITVNILFRYSNTRPNGTFMETSSLSESTSVLYTIPWNTFINALRADAKTENDVTANNSLPGTALRTNIAPNSANGRAIGLTTPPAMFANGTVGTGGPYDGIVTLNSNQPFQFSRPPSGSNYDAQGSTEHEIDEVLGLGSYLGQPGNDLQPQDLFSWAAPATRNLASTGSRYFSINSGNTNIVGFNQDSLGDFGDWLSDTCPQANPYVQNAFGCSGQFSDVTVSSPEGIALDVIGYDLGSPAQTCPPTITQSSSQEITQGDTISCNTGPPGYFHHDTSYWRAFNMAAFTGSRQYYVTSVSFGIDTAHSGAGSGQPLTVRLYTNTGGAFPGGSRTQIAATSVTVMDQTLTVLNVPLAATVPAGTSELVMEVFTPNGIAAGNSFFIGANAAAQTGTSYASAADCGNPAPTDTADLGVPNMHIVFNINGSCEIGPPTPAKALNISTRLRVEIGDNVMIGGFIITGNAPKNVVIRGIGPSLTGFGIPDALADPVLALRGANGTVNYQNDNWQDDPTQSTQIIAAGFALQNPLESGIAVMLLPGAYTAILTGRNLTTGVGLVEIYDTNRAADSQLGNVSTRGFVQTGSNVMIGGFILGGATGNTRVAIRGIGPSLSQSGLSNVLADPTLELHNSNGTTLVANDNWQDDPTSASQLAANGLALQNNLESGIFTTLPPGAFTAILAGRNGGTGIGLVEVYNLQ